MDMEHCKRDIKIKDCPFCEKTRADYILESDRFATIYNISPILPGHCLVIPKWHCESLLALNKYELSEFMMMSRQLAELLIHVFDTRAFDWAIQEGEEAGQSQKHLHMHVVPRKIGDLKDPGAWYGVLNKVENDLDTFERFRLTDEQLKDQTERMKEAAASYFKNDSFLSSGLPK